MARGVKYGKFTCHILHPHAFYVGCKIWRYTRSKTFPFKDFVLVVTHGGSFPGGRGPVPSPLLCEKFTTVMQLLINYLIGVLLIVS